ncbi:MAG: alpha-E domain-containing protein, partial [Planctomycetaceae bacterium]|nr:alpha-E domain-containing protein [Planctomycetaceae bacterium]
SAFHGLCSDSMTRGPGWRFLDIGRRIERGLQILDFVSDILVDGRTEILPQLEAMLEIADSSMTYRYRYLTTLQLAPVLDLIIADETNPRSVAFQFATLAEHVRQLSTGRNPEVPNQEQQLVLEAQGGLRLTDVEALCEVGPNKQRQALQAFQKRVSHELMNLSDAIMHTYVTHTTPPQQLGGLPPELLEDEL